MHFTAGIRQISAKHQHPITIAKLLLQQNDMTNIQILLMSIFNNTIKSFNLLISIFFFLSQHGKYTIKILNPHDKHRLSYRFFYFQYVLDSLFFFSILLRVFFNDLTRR